jgi:hypothetical protein
VPGLWGKSILKRRDNEVSADGLQDETDLYFANGAKFTKPVSLKDAKIDGDLNMTGAGFDGLLDA